MKSPMTALAAGLALTAALGLAACGPSMPPDPQPSLTPPTLTCSAAGVAASDASTLATVCLLTSQGELVVELEETLAPLTVANFLGYVGEGFYDATLFHRVVAGFVVQGGGFDTSGLQKAPTRPAVALESANGLKNLRGTLAMARLSGLPDSATSQFFVNLVDNPALDYQASAPTAESYAVFGRVISGLETVDRIAALPTFASWAPYPRVILYWARRLK
jgi:peptidyl-prolyl cis-trans isomerase A (cyclophilin A)